MNYPVIFTLALALSLSACSKVAPNASSAKPTLLVAAHDVFTLQPGSLTSGPTITGSIEPERRADLRAEVPAVVLQVLKDNGDKVRRGELLVRLDDTAIRENLASAQEAVRAASLSFDQSGRVWQRLRTLRESGMASVQQLEDAQAREDAARSELSAAKARVVQARQQLERTLARAPFDGVVSERKVSVGDTTQIGKELLKVMDPASLRFEGRVSADAVGQIKPGQAVHFQVSGSGAQEFSGTVKRINPAANATTGQIEVLVGFADSHRLQLAGLYAEGHIEASARPTLMLPALVLAREGDKAFVWRLSQSRLQKVAVLLGQRDLRSGDYVALGGVNAGDLLLRNPGPSLKDGQPVQLAGAGQ